MNYRVFLSILILNSGAPLFAQAMEDAQLKAEDAAKNSANWKAESLGAAAAEMATGQFDKAAMHIQQAQAAQVGEEKNKAIAEKVRQEDSVDGRLGVGHTKVITIGREIPGSGSPVSTVFPGSAPTPAAALAPSPSGLSYLPANETPDFSVFTGGSAAPAPAPEVAPSLSAVSEPVAAGVVEQGTPSPAPPSVQSSSPSVLLSGGSAPVEPLTLLDALRDGAVAASREPASEAAEAPPEGRRHRGGKSKEPRPRTAH